MITFVKSIFLLVLTVLAGHAAADEGDTYVYVSESKERRVVTYSFDQQSGQLTRLGAIDLSGAPGCLALSSDKQRIYAAVRTSSEFATLNIDKDTGLLSIASTASAAGSAAYVYPDHTGKWLLAAYFGEGLASVSKIDAAGNVVGKPVQVEDIGKKAHCIQTDPGNNFAFVPHPVELNKVTQFRFDAASGKLTLNNPPSMVASKRDGPRHLQFHPNRKWVYVVNEQSKSVTLCDYDEAEGLLKERKNISCVPATWNPDEGSCADIEISQDGRFVYASNRGHNSIAQFAIDQANGELTSLGQVKTEDTPRSFNLVPDGEKWLIAAGQRNHRIAVYKRDTEAGTLAQVGAYDCGQGPAWVLAVSLK